MNRRELILSLSALGSGAVGPALAACAEAEELSAAHVEALLRELLSVTPAPGEAAAVAEALRSLRRDAQAIPRVQPALGFNPEVEL